MLITGRRHCVPSACGLWLERDGREVEVGRSEVGRSPVPCPPPCLEDPYTRRVTVFGGAPPLRAAADPQPKLARRLPLLASLA